MFKYISSSANKLCVRLSHYAVYLILLSLIVLIFCFLYFFASTLVVNKDLYITIYRMCIVHSLYRFPRRLLPVGNMHYEIVTGRHIHNILVNKMKNTRDEHHRTATNDDEVVD